MRWSRSAESTLAGNRRRPVHVPAPGGLGESGNCAGVVPVGKVEAVAVSAVWSALERPAGLCAGGGPPNGLSAQYPWTAGVCDFSQLLSARAAGRFGPSAPHARSPVADLCRFVTNFSGFMSDRALGRVGEGAEGQRWLGR